MGNPRSAADADHHTARYPHAGLLDGNRLRLVQLLCQTAGRRGTAWALIRDAGGARWVDAARLEIYAAEAA